MCVEGAMAGYEDLGLASCSVRGGANGAAATDATAVDMMFQVDKLLRAEATEEYYFDRRSRATRCARG